LKIPDGGRLSFWKFLYRRILVKNKSILIKFCAETHCNVFQNSLTKTYKNVKIQYGGRTPYWKILPAITRQRIVRFARKLPEDGKSSKMTTN